MVSAVVLWAATWAQTWLVGWIGQRVLQDLRIQLFAHLQVLSIGFYSRRQAGVIISRLTNDVQALDQLVSDGVVTLFGSSLTLVGTAAILIVLDWQLALLTFLIFPVLGIGSFAFRIISADAYRATREKVAAITAYLQETLSGVRVVRVFGQERRHERVFSELNDENRAANMTTVNLNAAYFPAVELLSALVTAGILLYGGLQAIQGDVTVGVLVAFIAALNNFFDPIQQLSQLYTTYQAGMAALDKIFELLDEEPDLRDRPGALALPRLRGDLRFDHVSFAYAPGGENALTDIDLHVPAGQTVALVGSTGAGKSTFAKLAARFYDPTEGAILADGHDLRDVQAAVAPRPARDRAPGGLPLLGHDPRQPRLRPAGRDARGGRARGAGGRRPRLHRGARARLRDRDRRARDPALGGPAPARRVHARADLGPADPRPRRGDLERRHPHRVADRGRPAAAARRPHRGGHRAPAVDDPRRRTGSSCSSTGGSGEQGTHDELIAAEGAYWRLYRDWAEQAAAA